MAGGKINAIMWLWDVKKLRIFIHDQVVLCYIREIQNFYLTQDANKHEVNPLSAHPNPPNPPTAPRTPRTIPDSVNRQIMPLLTRQHPRPRRLAQLKTETKPDRLPARLALRPVPAKPLPLVPVPASPLLARPLPGPGFQLPAELFLAPPELVDDEAAVELGPRGFVASASLEEDAPVEAAEAGEVGGFFEGGCGGVGVVVTVSVWFVVFV